MHGSDMGDYIGTESGVDLIKGGGCCGGDGGGNGKRDQRSGIGREIIKKWTKEYPPPIRCLARTENVPSSHLPWVMKRYYTSDGRLIIREEKSPNSDFLRARRSNGRLTLQLVPMAQDDDADSNHEVEEVRENVEGVVDDDIYRVAGGGDGGKAVVNCSGGGVGVKCYNYEAVKSTCMYVDKFRLCECIGMVFCG